MRELLFHVGPHKTGTTALQRYLHDHRSALLAAGAYLPRPIGPDRSLNAWYLVFVGTREPRRLATYHNAIRGRHDEAACAEMKRRFTADLAEEFAGASRQGMDRVLLSSEEVSFLDRDDWNSLYAWLQGFFESISLVYYLRNPYRRLASDLQQALKGGSVLSASVLSRLRGLDHERIAAMEPYPPHRQAVRLAIRPYREGREQGDGGDAAWNVVRDFCQAHGLPVLGDLTSYARVNQGISAQMMGVVNEINRQLPPLQADGTYNPLRYHLHHAIEAYRWTEWDTPFRFTAADLAVLASRLEPLRAELLAYCSRQEWLRLDYDPSYGRHPEALEAGGSALEMVHELPQAYYVNLLCHFWAYLRLREMRQRSPQPARRGEGPDPVRER